MGNPGKQVKPVQSYTKDLEQCVKKTLFKFVAFQICSPKQGQQGPEGEAGPTGPRGPPVSKE